MESVLPAGLEVFGVILLVVAAAAVFGAGVVARRFSVPGPAPIFALAFLLVLVAIFVWTSPVLVAISIALGLFGLGRAIPVRVKSETAR